MHVEWRLKEIISRVELTGRTPFPCLMVMMWEAPHLSGARAGNEKGSETWRVRLAPSLTAAVIAWTRSPL